MTAARPSCNYCDRESVETLANGPALIPVCDEHRSRVP